MTEIEPILRYGRATSPRLLVLGAAIFAGCGGGRVASVGPTDVPALRAAVAEAPQDGETTLLLAAALHASGNCGEAIDVASRGAELRPQDALAPLVIGGCLSERDELERALSVYESFSSEYPASPGSATVEAQAMLTRREIGARSARRLLADETALAANASDPDVLAVMPIEMVGNDEYAALSLGLSAMITSDLALVPAFRLVERSELGGVLREIALSRAGRVDPRSAVEAGKLVRAGRVVHGVTLIATDDRLRFDATVTDEDGRNLGDATVSGHVRQLLQLEKDLVVELIGELGYALSEAERTAILENGTDNLMAFLAYSQGLVEQELGNYDAAEDHFARAVQQDPSFSQARMQHRISVGGAAVQGVGASPTRMAGLEAPDPMMPAAEMSVASAVSAGPRDLSPSVADGLIAPSQIYTLGRTSIYAPPPTATGVLTQLVDFGFRLVFILP